MDISFRWKYKFPFSFLNIFLSDMKVEAYYFASTFKILNSKKVVKYLSWIREGYIYGVSSLAFSVFGYFPTFIKEVSKFYCIISFLHDFVNISILKIRFIVLIFKLLNITLLSDFIDENPSKVAWILFRILITTDLFPFFK